MMKTKTNWNKTISKKEKKQYLLMNDQGCCLDSLISVSLSSAKRRFSDEWSLKNCEVREA